MNKMFSILTSSHNYGRYLKGWAKSILKQNYRPLEVVFVNDYSDDDTHERLKIIKQQFDDAKIAFKVVSNPVRVHYGTCCKIADENASGHYFGHLDSDDQLVEGAVESVVNVYEKFLNIAYIYTQFNICDINMKYKKPGFSQAPPNGECLLSLAKSKQHGLSHWRTYSKRVPDRSKLWRPGLRCAVDKFFAYRLEEQCQGLFYDKVCYNYRWGDKQAISKTEKPMDYWRLTIDDTTRLREIAGIKAIPIIKYKD
jgi:glycosyltransferase involved in cell wall biosynthesis